MNTTNQGRIVILGGGIPLIYQNKVIGGIGVSAYVMF
nr:heme-binding protein [Ureibacillus sinduriensis]